MAKVTRTTTSGAIQLSPHFYLSEFTDSTTAERDGIDNTPNPLVSRNLFRLAELMEGVRAVLGGKVISVSSGYRSPALNAAINGSYSSEHMTGEACDFVCRAFGTPLQVAAAIAKSGLKWGQLIQEGRWIHISLPSAQHNQEVLTAHFTPGRKTTYSLGL